MNFAIMVCIMSFYVRSQLICMEMTVSYKFKFMRWLTSDNKNPSGPADNRRFGCFSVWIRRMLTKHVWHDSIYHNCLVKILRQSVLLITSG